MKLVLIGYMGSGKSSIGKLLSSALNVPFLDLDIYIEEREGKSISALFETKGEIYFRKKEAFFLEEALKTHEKIILATGGGTPCYGTIMEDLLKLENVLIIYLQCSVATLTQRLWFQKKERPLIAHSNTKEDLHDFIRKHLFERSYFYNKAHNKILCDTFSEKEIVEKIVLQLF
ncbi:MAG: shikimate kinase [Flavobacteriaceae bacterium]